MGRPAPNVNLFGIALVIIATALGIYLIIRSFDTGTAKTTTSSTSSTTSTTAAGTDTTAVTSSVPGGSTSTSLNLGTVKVLVLNASGKSGAAGRLANTLQAAGFTAAKGTAKNVRSTTVVYYVDGAKAEALAVASVINLGADAVTLMPQPSPVDAATLADNKVLVLLGTDKAT